MRQIKSQPHRFSAISRNKPSTAIYCPVDLKLLPIEACSSKDGSGTNCCDDFERMEMDGESVVIFCRA